MSETILTTKTQRGEYRIEYDPAWLQPYKVFVPNPFRPGSEAWAPFSSYYSAWLALHQELRADKQEAA